MLEVNVTNENFEKEVVKSDKPTIVDFWASWCGPCQMLAPILSEIAEQYKDKVKVCKVNVDEEQELARRFNIASIPTLIIFKDEAIVKSTVGFRSKEELESIINNL